jgi:hypothetical protein
MAIRLEVSDGHKADARPVPPGSSRVGREQPCTDGKSSSGGGMLKTIDSINFDQNSLTKAASRQRSSALSRRSRAWPRLSAYFDSRITKARRLACAQEKSATARVCIKLLRRPEGTKRERELPSRLADVSCRDVPAARQCKASYSACGPRAPCPGGGRETVTHAHVASAHDDLAASSCGALVAAGDRLAYISDLSRWVGLRVTGNYGCSLQTRQTSEK